MPTPPQLYAHDLNDVLKKKTSTGTYKSLVFYLEACDSGSNFDGLLPKGMNIYATTSTKPDELGWAIYCAGDSQNPSPKKYYTCLGDFYSVAWMEDSQFVSSDIHNPGTETLEQQYELIKVRTFNNNSNRGSHVMRFGDIGLSQANLSLYIGANSTNTFVDQTEDYLWSPSQTINQQDADLVNFWNKFEKAPEGSPRKAEARKQFVEAMSHRTHVDSSVKLIGALLFGIVKSDEMLNTVRPTGQPLVDDWDCLKAMVRTFETHCGSLSQYGMKHMRSFANNCNAGIKRDQMDAASTQVCVSVPSRHFSDPYLENGFRA